MQKRVFVQIIDATTPNAEPLFAVSLTPFTAAYGVPMPTDRVFHFYEALRDGLRDRFDVPETMVPGRAFFEPTPEEREYEEDPIYRTVAF